MRDDDKFVRLSRERRQTQGSKSKEKVSAGDTVNDKYVLMNQKPKDASVSKENISKDYRKEQIRGSKDDFKKIYRSLERKKDPKRDWKDHPILCPIPASVSPSKLPRRKSDVGLLKKTSREAETHSISTTTTIREPTQGKLFAHTVSTTSVSITRSSPSMDSLVKSPSPVIDKKHGTRFAERCRQPPCPVHPNGPPAHLMSLSGVTTAKSSLPRWRHHDVTETMAHKEKDSTSTVDKRVREKSKDGSADKIHADQKKMKREPFLIHKSSKSPAPPVDIPMKSPTEPKSLIKRSTSYKEVEVMPMTPALISTAASFQLPVPPLTSRDHYHSSCASGVMKQPSSIGHGSELSTEPSSVLGTSPSRDDLQHRRVSKCFII
jgi:hypothetical protein